MDVDQAMRLAVEHHHAGRLGEASTLYRRILEAVPDHPGALASLAMVFHGAGEHASALALVERATAGAPQVAGFWLNRGAVERALARFDAALASHERALALDPGLAEGYYNLCDLLLALDRPTDAVAVCRRRLERVPADWRALAFEAHALEVAGELAGADRLLDHRRFRRQVDFAAPKGYPDIAAFNRALARHILAHPTLAPDPPGRSTRSGHHTGELLEGALGPMKPFRKLVRQAVGDYLRRLPDDADHPFVAAAPKGFELTSWALVLGSGGHEVAHIHPGGWLSGVYYVALPPGMGADPENRAGWLEFGRPTAELTYRAEPRLHQVPPKAGRLYLFPSYFYHGTIPFRHDQPRICISFDVRPKRR